jgi:hypothetical protein
MFAWYRRLVALIASSLAFLPAIASGSDYDTLNQYAGYYIIGTKTIAGYVDKDGKREDSFQGCDWGRTIVFTDDTYAVCAGYGYQYAYRPTALLLSKDGSLVMLVEGDKYSMRFR